MKAKREFTFYYATYSSLSADFLFQSAGFFIPPASTLPASPLPSLNSPQKTKSQPS